MKRTTTFSGHTKAQEDAFKELAQTINFNALAKFYSNSYFTRLWIIQEIALSQKAVLTVKPWSIIYDDFAMATAVLNSLMKTLAFDAGSLSVRSAWDVVSIKLAYTRKQSRDILTDAELEAVNDDLWRPDWMSLTLLDMVDSINSKCLDPKDRIYGLLSLNKDDVHDIDLIADYSKSTAEVYTDFAKAYLVQKHIRILNLAGVQRKTRNPTHNNPLQAHASAILSHDTTPSWAPDWREPRPYMALGGFNRPGFTAGFSLSTHVEMVPSNPTKILIFGFQIDTVTHISRPVNVNAAHTGVPPLYETHEPARASIAAFQALCESYYQDAGITKYATGEDILTAFVRTVLADGIYGVFGDLFPVMKASPKQMVLFWLIFASLKIKPDDTIHSALNTNLPNMQTGDSEKSRGQSVRIAWLVVSFMLTALSNHAVFITSQGYLGLGHALTEVGDSVVIFGGSQTPFVMRKMGLAGVAKDYCILEDCYLHGFMYGELLTEVRQAAVEMFGIF